MTAWQTQERLTSRNRSSRQFKSPGTAFVLLCVCGSVAVGGGWLSPAPVIAQTTSLMDPPSGMRATSPLAAGATRSTGIPLGATEIATPGVSPVNPAQNMASCAGGAGLSEAPFDGGGLSASAPLSCADGCFPSSSRPLASMVGRVGIPLGATELGGNGIVPPAPVTAPSLSSSASSMTNPGNP